MLAGRRGIDNGRQKPEIMVMTSLQAESYLLITWITLANCHAKPKIKSTGAGRYQLLPVEGYLPQRLGLKDPSPKSQDAVLQQIMSVALYLWLIGDIRQAIDRCSNICFTAGRWLWSFPEHKASTAWLQNSKKRAERSGDWADEQSHRDYLRSGYLHHRSPVMGC